jgi:hypothetical protein
MELEEMRFAIPEAWLNQLDDRLETQNGGSRRGEHRYLQAAPDAARN